MNMIEKLKQYLDKFAYSEETKRLRVGGLVHLYDYHGHLRMTRMLTSHDWEESCKYLEENAKPGSLVNGDILSFKLAWEAIHGKIITNKRVAKVGD